MSTYKALLVGCGNIGALYDIDNDNVFTHAKAYSIMPETHLSIFDTNKDLVNKVASKYNANVIENIATIDFGQYDIISICSPTKTHYGFLKQALESNTKVIVCEKPVSDNIDEIENLITLYKSSNTKVLVNYIRRFHPNYIELKEVIQNITKEEILHHVSIRYQRGFINNCSHAFDLLQFFFDKEIHLADLKKNNIMYDHFDSDPTLSLQAKWGQTNVNVLGLSDVKYTYFEIELFFTYHKIIITQSGQNIKIYKADKSAQNLQSLQPQKEMSKQNALDNYMMHVIDKAYSLLRKEVFDDNFLSAAQLNKQLLTYIQ